MFLQVFWSSVNFSLETVSGLFCRHHHAAIEHLLEYAIDARMLVFHTRVLCDDSGSVLGDGLELVTT